VNQYTGWASGELYVSIGLIIKTTNGGLNWFTQYIDSSYYYISSIFYINQNTGWAGGAPGPILKTTNGGINWFYQAYGKHLWLGSIYFIDPNTGWAVVDTINTSGIILKTTNGGTNWFYQTSGTSYGLFSVIFIDQNTGWIAGGYAVYDGIILKTTNGGTNWYTQYQDTLYNLLYGIQFVDQNTGWVIGENSYSYGKIIKTTNGGRNWFLQYNANYYILQSLYFIDQYSGWSGGADNIHNGIVIKTTDGGSNWYEQFNGSGPNHELFSINFINMNSGWAVGNNGIIINTTNGGEPIGIKPISSNVPESFLLYQNYPNPFNPSTKIKFQIPVFPLMKGVRGMSVRLSIYDLLGREIATLVNEQLQPGTYEVEWDGGNYSSGVYFYKLEAGSFTDTKKMLMIK
jgi:photosystem II stability/assembly factor-like uncharacterized protein